MQIQCANIFFRNETNTEYSIYCYLFIIDSRLQHVLGVSSPTYSGAYNLPRDKRRIYCLNAEDVADI